MLFILQIFLLLLTCFTNTVNATAAFTKVALPNYEVTFSKSENEVEKSIVKLSLLATDLKAVGNRKKVNFLTNGD
jgi:hypothetical protein